MNELLSARSLSDAVRRALPETEQALACLEEEWAEDGDVLGEYIISDATFETELQILAGTRPCPSRDRLLDNVFSFLDELVASDWGEWPSIAMDSLGNIPNWWLYSERQRIGPALKRSLDKWRSEWRSGVRDFDLQDPIDIYGVRYALLEVVNEDGLGPADLPGGSAPCRAKRLTSLREAQATRNGVAFLSACGTTFPYVVVPAQDVRCDEATLQAVASSLHDVNPDSEPRTCQPAVGYFEILLGERVWNMLHAGGEGHREGKVWVAPPREKHGRWDGQLWIAPHLPDSDRQAAESFLKGKANREET